MSFRKICEEEEKENQQRIKSLQNACGAMRVMLSALNGGQQIPSRHGDESDDSLMEDNYEEEKKIDDQFLRHKEILDNYAQITESYDVVREHFSKIIRIFLRIMPSVQSFTELKDPDMRDAFHSRMDKIGIHAFCKKAGTRRFPFIIRKLETVLSCANRTVFDEPQLNLKLSFNEKLRILKKYYETHKNGGTAVSPLRIAGVELLQSVDTFLSQTRDGYKRSRQMRKSLGL